MTEAQQIESLQAENAALRRRLAELELARSDAAAPPPASADPLRERLERLFAQAPIAVFETGMDLKTRLWNQAAERIFGYSESDLLGQDPYAVLLQTRDADEMRRGAAEMKTKGWTRSIHPATTKDGRQVLCSWVATYLTDRAGAAVGIGCFCRDVTAEKESERGRRESDAMLAATFETAGVGLCILDERGHFLRVNRTYCKMYGWPSAELIGQHFTMVVPEELRPWARDGYDSLIQSGFIGMVPSLEITVKRRDNTVLAMVATYSVIALEDGRRIQICAVTDITQSKEQAAELGRRMQDAEREAAEKTRLLAELDQKLEVIAHQNQQILQLSAPVLDIWDGVLLLPLIGSLDGRRVGAITELLLQAVVERRTRNVILDMTSLEMMDTANAGYVGRMVQALRMLGVRSIITGIRPTAAQTMVQMGVDLQGVVTVRDLQQGLRACIR